MSETVWYMERFEEVGTQPPQVQRRFAELWDSKPIPARGGGIEMLFISNLGFLLARPSVIYLESRGFC